MSVNEKTIEERISRIEEILADLSSTVITNTIMIDDVHQSLLAHVSQCRDEFAKIKKQG